MGRKRSKKGIASSKHSPGLAVPEPWLPHVVRVKSQEELDLEVDRNIALDQEIEDQKQRLREAGFKPYQRVKYRGVSANIVDVRDNTAIIDYCSLQYKVKLENVKRV